jgi:hypothetical protein
MVALRRRREHEPERHPQDIAKKHADRHLDVAPRMPNAKGPPSGCAPQGGGA